MSSQLKDDQFYMLQALEQAKLALGQGEVPIGAVIVYNQQLIAQSFNQIESSNDATAHAEALAIRAASKALNNWRLDNCTLYVTLEPCLMCLGAIRLARIKRVVIGAQESRMGAVSKFPQALNDSTLGPIPEICQGVLEQECRAILKEFFKSLRN